ncbi:MAG: HAD family hydrolase [Ignavibacteria bacterium]
MIKAIIFDLGNVLIYFDWKIAENRLNELQSGTGTIITKFLKENNSIIKMLEKGALDETEFLDIIKSHLNSNIDKHTIAKIFSEIFQENKILTNLLSKIKKEYKLFLLSNTNIIHKKYGWGHYEFLKHFDRLFLSYEIGSIKPEKEIFDFVINSIELKPEEVLYIDDIEDYVKAAKNLGWNALQFISNEKLLEDLKKFNIDLNLF